MTKEKSFRTIFDRPHSNFECTGVSMTHQSHADACDINKIIAKFDSTGILPPGRHEPIYADVSNVSGDLCEMSTRAQEVLEKTSDFIESAKKSRAKKKLPVTSDDSQSTQSTQSTQSEGS